jgi:hypothetical protein
MRFNHWTAEELELLKNSYGRIPAKEIYALIPRHPKNMLKLKANSFGLKDVRYWTQDDLDYLGENLGTISDKAICKHLGRSINAIHIQCVRKLGINHKVNIYTAREAAKILGVACSKTITAWMRRGWIEGKKSSIRCGSGLMWYFTYEAIKKFCRTRPWMLKPTKMEESYFRSIVKEEYVKNPWYSIPKACRMVGVAYQSSAMAFYLKKKWLHPEKKPIEGGNHWTWIFLKSDIDQFLANDPRRLRPLQATDTRRRKAFEAGRAIRIYSVWKMKCPKCHKTVRVKASPRLEGPAVKRLLLDKYGQGENCTHKWMCQVEKELKPYKPRKSQKKELCLV